MATSIAKLAILLTTDTSGMVRGFAKARTEVTGFQSAVMGLSRGFALVGGAAAAIGASKWIMGIANDSEQAMIRLEALTGSMEKAQEMTKMVQSFGAGLFEDREILNATTKLLAFGKTADEIPGILQNLGDLAISTDQSLESLATRFVKSADSADKLTEAGKRAAGSMQNLTDSATGQWKLLWDNLEDTARPAANAVGDVVEEVLRSVNSLFLTREQRLDSLFGGDGGGTKIIRNVTEIKGLLDDGAKSAKQIADESARFMDRGADLARTLRTPAEVFTDSLKEAQSLFQAGAITAETYRRAAEDAQRQFDAANESARRAVETIRGGTAATTYGSQGGFQAVAEARRATEYLRQINQKVGKPAINLPVVNF